MRGKTNPTQSESLFAFLQLAKGTREKGGFIRTREDIAYTPLVDGRKRFVFDSFIMPWQVVPSILIIMGAFNLTAAGIWAVDRVYYGKQVSEIECAVRFPVRLS
jgi:hypothetical protein